MRQAGRASYCVSDYMLLGSCRRTRKRRPGLGLSVSSMTGNIVSWYRLVPRYVLNGVTGVDMEGVEGGWEGIAASQGQLGRHGKVLPQATIGWEDMGKYCRKPQSAGKTTWRAGKTHLSALFGLLSHQLAIQQLRLFMAEQPPTSTRPIIHLVLPRFRPDLEERRR
jgi:hypothetical protein